MKNSEKTGIHNCQLKFALCLAVLIIASLINQSCRMYGVKQTTPEVLAAGDGSSVKEIPINVKSEEEIKSELEALHQLEKENYKISTGDRFLFRVYDYPELRTPSIIVLPGGQVSLPLAGTVKIGGLTIREANTLISEKLSQFIKNPRATLVPKYIKGSIFTIVGKVRKTGVFQLKRGYNITDAVAVSGGLSMGEKNNDTIELADLSHAYIARDSKLLPVDFVKAVRMGDPLNNIPLKNGDFIYIPSSMDRSVFVMGQVKNPGNIPFNEGQTMLQALSYAKGRLWQTAGEEVYVVRGNLLKPKVFMVNAEDILHGRAPDFRLEPNDVVYVPRSTMAEYNMVIEDILPTVELLNLMTGPFGSTALAIPVNIAPITGAPEN